MQGAIVYSWGTPRMGREQAALTSFADAMAFWGKRQADGTADASIPVLRSTGTGGLWVITGDEDRLREASQTDEHRKIVIAAAGSVEDFRVEFGAAGNGLEAQMALYGQTLGELGWS